MPEPRWPIRPLSEVVSLQRGYDLPASQRGLGKIPVIGSAGLSGTHNRAAVIGPGVTIGRSGSLGVATWVPQDYWPLNTVLYATDFHGNDPRFVYYLLRSLDFRGYNSGSVQPSLNRNFIAGIDVPVPPSREQAAIGALLGTLDDAIDLNCRINHTLDAIARALFARATAKGGGAARLEHLVALNPKRDMARGALAPYVDMRALPTNGAMVSDIRSRPFTSGSRFINGDTLLARITPCLENGKTAFVDCLGSETGWGSTEFIVLRPRAPLPEEYAYLLARSESFRSYAIATMTGSSGRQRVPVEALAGYPAPALTEEAAISLQSVVRPLFELMRAKQDESMTLERLRDALLPELISGRMTVN